MITSPVLAHFHEERETILEANSSEYAIKGLLLQKDEKEWWKPVAYYSKKHDTAEVNYPIHDKELLAIINCIKAWEPELKAVKSFKILTDHRNLRYFYTEKQLTERQVRWSELSDKPSHLRCWRLRSADQLPTGLVLSGAPGPHLQERAASRLKLKKATYNNKGINKSKTNNISNISIVLSKIVIILFKIL
jgi:hypothetical protein